MRLMDTLLPSRWKESKQEKFLKSTSIHTGKVRGLAHSHYPYPFPPGFWACPNVSDRVEGGLKLGSGDHQEVGINRLGTDSGGPWHQDSLWDFYLLSVDTPWKVLKLIFFVHWFIYYHIVIE